MSKKLLIDAAHSEELRVVLTKNGIVEDFDYQNNHKKSTKGNIYLAKVTRVEPSLQAAFVDYGGNRHGFLPFAEIHPDYFQLPAADKEKLFEELEQNRRDQEARSEARENERKKKDSPAVVSADITESVEVLEDLSETKDAPEPVGNSRFKTQEDMDDDSKPQFYKRYKIQEVIKKDQVILVQVEKEERGNKGAALTSYISIAGRYCVLMPNATKGGGVSRKISDDQDRDRLKKIAREISQNLDGTGAIIIRTAGAFKTKTEITKDCAYLQKLWNKIRENTIKSNAPTFIHEEADVVKKAIRDLYEADIEQIVIDGKAVFEEATEFMKMILPKHVHKLTLHSDKTPLYAKFKIEEQLASLYSPQVELKSGGYIVINQTEALVAIDVNSGRSTSERNVENTAARTNVEAAYEIARQLRLRDLSGLIVIDFIDMLDSKNRKAVEKSIKEATANDKAKIQLSRISPFGLLEMSRQRIRQSLGEANTEICNHCIGRGRIRTVDSSAIILLRAIESELATYRDEILLVSASTPLIFAIMNNKRKELAELEKRYPERIIFSIDESAGGDGFFFEKKRNPRAVADTKALSSIDSSMPDSHDLPESEENVTENVTPSAHPRNKKIRFKKRREHSNNESHHSKPKFENPEPRAQRDANFGDEAEVSQPTTHASSTDIDASRSKRNPRRHHGKKPYVARKEGSERPYEPVNNREDSEAADFDQEMAKRRQNNQSLLKEIWKKIVD